MRQNANGIDSNDTSPFSGKYLNHISTWESLRAKHKLMAIGSTNPKVGTPACISQYSFHQTKQAVFLFLHSTSSLFGALSSSVFKEATCYRGETFANQRRGSVPASQGGWDQHTLEENMPKTGDTRGESTSRKSQEVASVNFEVYTIQQAL